MQWKRWGRRALALGLCFTLAAPAGAVGVEYPDLDESHWAYDQMDQARELGILSGGSGGTMDPDGTLTWGQFLTMVGRTFYRETYDAAPAGDNWADQGYQAALDAGVLEEDDFLPVSAQGLEAEVNRQSAAEVFYRVVPQESLGGNSWWYGERDAAAELSDWNQIPAQYREAVSALYEERILNGTGDGRFDGEGTLTRAAGAVLLMGVLEAVDSTRRGEEVTVTVHMVDREGQTIQPDYTAQVQVGESYYSLADAPEGYRFVGPYYDVSALSQEVTLQYRRLTADELAEERAWNQYQSGEITYEQYMPIRISIAEGENPESIPSSSAGETSGRFENQEQAAAAMTTVTVPVWKLSNGQKVSSTVSFQINAGLAEDVRPSLQRSTTTRSSSPSMKRGAIPGGGTTPPASTTAGSAIDLNANENYQVREGQALVGLPLAAGG